MREMRHTDEPQFEIVAVGSRNTVLFVTETADSHEEAKNLCDRCNNPRPSEADTIPAEVDHYKIREA